MESGLLLALLLCGLCTGANGRCSPRSVFSCETCPPGWIWFGSHCYWFEKSEKTWADAELFCISHDGNLASVHTQADYIFLRDLIYRVTGKHAETWVGGHDAVKEGFWMWTDGSRFTFNTWAKGEPNNAGGKESCMELNLKEGDGANDTPCDRKIPFVCMRDP